jgi:ubiquinone/menaquinone biosynthesis C-methylase UbiE
MAITLLRHGAAALAAWLLLAGTGAAQLGGRPADEWVRTLESPERIASLKIPEVVTALELQPGSVIADLGAGSGPFESAFAKAVGPSGKVYAVEVDKAFLTYIESKARAAGITNVRTVLGEFTDPKLPASDVDVAFLHDVLHHIQDRPGYLKAVVKYLKPSARIVIIDYNPARSPHSADPALQVSKEQAAAWLSALGFTPVKDVPLAPDKWFVIYGR